MKTLFSRKIWIPLAAILAAAVFAGLWFTADAAAQGNKPGRAIDRQRKAQAILGQVTQVGTGQFTIKNRDGQEVTFAVNEDTQFRNRDKEELSLADLKVGRWVAVAAPRAPGRRGPRPRPAPRPRGPRP